MAVGSGIAASFGVGVESTYGTYVAQTRFLRGAKFSVDKQFEVVPVGGLAAGIEADLDEVMTTEWGMAKLEAQVLNRDWGLLLQHLMGGSAAPVQQGGTAAFLQTHVWSDPVGKYLSTQVGVPDTGGTVRPYTGLGSKFVSAEFSCEAKDVLMMSAELDVRQVSEAQSLVAPSYGTGRMPFHGRQMAVRLGTFGAEASVTGVRKATAKFDRGLDTERFYGGNAGLKAEPLWSEQNGVTGTLEIDYATKADFVDRYVNNTATSLVMEWVGPLIAGGFFETFRLKFPKVKFGGQVPEVDGPGVSKAAIPFKAFRDTTNGYASVEYMSIDTAV